MDEKVYEEDSLPFISLEIEHMIRNKIIYSIIFYFKFDDLNIYSFFSAFGIILLKFMIWVLYTFNTKNKIVLSLLFVNRMMSRIL